ncbi:MAG: carbohydrate ABC transporter permease [Catenulispora sp.]
MRLRKKTRERLFIASFLAGPLAVYIVFVIWPYIETFGYSLTEWTGVAPPSKVVGLKNYTALMHDSVFLKALWHNIEILVFFPTITIILAMFFAFMLNVGGRRGGVGGVKGVRGSAFYRVVFFFPQVLSVAILVILFQAVFETNNAGLFNGIAIKLGLTDADHPWEFLNSTTFVLWCIMFILVWQWVGFYLVLFSAAMQQIPKDYYEAALLDGAGRIQTYFKVTMPLLWDSVQTAWVYLAVAAMDAFALVANLTPGSNFGGGPDEHGEVLSTYLMRNFQTLGKAGYACAMGVVIFFITLILSLVVLRLTRRERLEY